MGGNADHEDGSFFIWSCAVVELGGVGYGGWEVGELSGNGGGDCYGWLDGRLGILTRMES